ncbi:MAG: AAA family ATPase [Lachnospiraceae bacterium]|nr:AAA family ATPase [Lachnospiraceae bacterium]MCQ2527479.1 AAA family ATPase [Lachnospiraceae bacterium]
MNIKEAKNYIKDTVRLYLKKDEYDEYYIPVVRQRPIFLLGAPGIGKTAIMEQIAQELGIALVAYSMTHHTRQSALGLPFIEHKNYGGEDYAVSEYTMSEIIASVYETIEKSGIKEGILFLDEINCVSETLAPSMLQFLQYKVFGRHQVPEGWVIVTAGNPPEYNKSVREFDVVTLDRLKILDVDADYEAWKSYAHERNIHGAIQSYLELNKQDFYIMETTAAGKSYVTARGWEDLSQILILYEADNLKVSEELVNQYLRSERVVREFTAYYDLFNKYKNDYKAWEIVDGIYSEETVAKAGAAAFDERISLMGILVTNIENEMREVCRRGEMLKSILPALKTIKTADRDAIDILSSMLSARVKKTEQLKAAGALSDDERKLTKLTVAFLSECIGSVEDVRLDGSVSNTTAFEVIRGCFMVQKANLQKAIEECQKHIHFAFEFTDKAYSQGNEMLILLTEMTVSEIGTRFLTDFGSEDYNKYSSEMLMTEKNTEILAEIEKLNL